MFHLKKREVANRCTDYAEQADFCEVFERNLEPFYLLAFLLTTNHKEAEHCLEETIEEAFRENSVFKAWVGPWVKRCLIKKAIHVVSSHVSASGESRNLWYEGAQEPGRSAVVNAISCLETLERCAFVTSILEGYSARECSLLLNCTTESVVHLRVRASCRLAASGPLFAENLARLSSRPKSR
jgi:DNA-directed RNA polymerase specialized sigma24 family protein